MKILKLQEQWILGIIFEIQNKNGLSYNLDTRDLITWRSDDDESLREVLLRFLAQIVYENSPLVPEESIMMIFDYAQSVAFLPEKLHKKESNIFYKTLRAAFNCIANLLA